jgi:hypothetical protein
MIPPPERETFERELDSIYSTGDKDTLARYLKVTPSYVSQLLNPYNERESLQYRIAWWQWATDCISLEKGDRLFALLKRDYDARRYELEPSRICPATATSEIGIQFSQFLKAELEGKPLDEQIVELEDIARAVEYKRQELLIKQAGRR